MPKLDDLVSTLATLVEQRYRDRVAVRTSAITHPQNAPAGEGRHLGLEISIWQTAKNSRQEVSMRFFGEKLPLYLTLRYQPGSAKSSIQVTDDGLFIWNGETLTAEGFVFKVFHPWFGGYARYD